MTIFRCKEPFTYLDRNGTPISVGIGDIAYSVDPEIVKRAAFFEVLSEGVEEATAEPGYLRARRGRPPKAAASVSEVEPEEDS